MATLSDLPLEQSISQTSRSHYAQDCWFLQKSICFTNVTSKHTTYCPCPCNPRDLSIQGKGQSFLQVSVHVMRSCVGLSKKS